MPATLPTFQRLCRTSTAVIASSMILSGAHALGATTRQAPPAPSDSAKRPAATMPVDQAQGAKAKADATLAQLRREFRGRIAAAPEVQAAQARVNDAQARTRAASSKGDAAAFAQASKDKAAAVADLEELFKRLEAADPQIGAARRDADLATRTLAASEDQAARLVAAQRAADQEVRDGAAKRVADERAAAAANYAAAMKADRSKVDRVKLVGDEANLTIVESKPRDYIDKPFIIAGVATMQDYFNYGYGDAKLTHYSIDFEAAIANGERRSQSVNLYQLRSLGDDILNAAAAGKVILRCKVTISSRYVRSLDEINGMFELLDWQFLGTDGKWSPWRSEAKQ